jgi:hypothetical protein
MSRAIGRERETGPARGLGSPRLLGSWWRWSTEMGLLVWGFGVYGFLVRGGDGSRSTFLVCEEGKSERESERGKVRERESQSGKERVGKLNGRGILGRI